MRESRENKTPSKGFPPCEDKIFRPKCTCQRLLPAAVAASSVQSCEPRCVLGTSPHQKYRSAPVDKLHCKLQLKMSSHAALPRWRSQRTKLQFPLTLRLKQVLRKIGTDSSMGGPSRRSPALAVRATASSTADGAYDLYASPMLKRPEACAIPSQVWLVSHSYHDSPSFDLSLGHERTPSLDLPEVAYLIPRCLTPVPPFHILCAVCFVRRSKGLLFTAFIASC